MEKRYHENDYLYAGARIRAAERIFPGRERLLSFAESKNEEELRAALVSGGIPAAKDLPESLVLFAMSLVRESLPDDLTVFVGYFYDCHNLKSLFKCRERGIDPEALLSPLGRVPVRELCKDFEKSDFSRLSPHMAAAAEECVWRIWPRPIRANLISGWTAPVLKTFLRRHRVFRLPKNICAAGSI